MALEAYWLCHPAADTAGAIPLKVFYTSPEIHFHFPYPGFQWLPVLSSHGMQFVVGLLAVGGVLLALGFLYRLSALMVFLAWGYLYALESTRTYWMSYHYLELLLSFLLLWLPAASRYSIDAWLRRGKNLPVTVPFWCIFLLRGQLLISYFYAGVAKLNADWLLDAEPVRYFLANSRALPHLGTTGLGESLRKMLLSDGLAYFISYAGAAFDLSVGFLMLCRRTRIFGMVLMVIFHATNHFVLFNDIVWFPLLGVATATIFLEPDWPERCWKWLRRPRVTKPDWTWAVGGAVLFPLAGASLGWKLAPTTPSTNAPPKRNHWRWIATFVIAWLGWQGLMPLRKCLIEGDSRFTWEGLSFSWRLKAEVYRSTPAELIVEDRAVVQTDPTGRSRIDWNEFRGEKVLYRNANPARLNWSQLPELLVTLEPMVGERILFNPLAGSASGPVEAQSRQRVDVLWRQLYGHPPEAVLTTLPLPQTFAACAAVLKARGYTINTGDEIFALLDKLVSQGEDRELLDILARMAPFALEGAPVAPNSPFLLIQDSAVLKKTGSTKLRIDAARWATGPATRSPRDSLIAHSGGEPMVVYTGAGISELRPLLPQAIVSDTLENPARGVWISWNYRTELAISQAMHMSTQPFLLRQYARHVALIWEKQHGRRPVIHGSSQVSLNGRPFQVQVAPDADLASVEVSRIRHNPWIRQLETPRIPGGRISTPGKR
jgi:uncharacterized membrane protein YphA (DoxX/SURF4 family)